jgi:Protein of unknown function (DUF3060)
MIMRSEKGTRAWPWALLALSAAVAARAAADDLTIQGVNVERTITCDDREVVIHGTNNRVTLNGRCRQVTVDGTAHVVRVETLGSADVSGVNNRLEWEHALRGDQPDIEIVGLGNRVVQVSGAAAARPAERSGSVTVEGDGSRVVVGPGGISVEGKSKGRRDAKVTVTGGGGAEPAVPRAITIEEGDLQRTYDCAGGSATVEGGENRLTLRRCPELTVSGADNRIVMVGPVRLIRLLGNDNTVEWSEGEGGKPPKVENPGYGNKVVRK